jgi:hypothetical protein
MIGAAATLLLAHACYLLITTGAKWGRSDLPYSSGYAFCAFLFIADFFVGSASLIAAYFPTTKRVRIARSVLAWFLLFLAGLYVIVGMMGSLVINDC